MQSKFLRPVGYILGGLVLIGVGYGFVTPQPLSSCFLNSGIYCDKGPVSNAAYWTGIGLLLAGAFTIIASCAWLYRLSLSDRRESAAVRR